MKLKVSHRLVLFIGALLMVFFGVAVLLGSLRFNQILIRKEEMGFFSLTRLGLLAGAALTIAFGLFCLMLPHLMKQSKAEFVTQKTPSGELKINVQAIESIIQKSLSSYEEIKLRHLKVNNTRAGIEVDAQASMAGNINIPLAANAIQKFIRQSLSASLGIDAKEVRVTVDSADMLAKESPYKIQEQELAIPDAAPAAPEEQKQPNQHR